MSDSPRDPRLTEPARPTETTPDGYAPPTIVPLGDVRTETLQTG